MRKYNDCERLRAFLSKATHVDSGCWEWLGGKSLEGYGLFYKGKVHMEAHRYSYETFIGPIPKGVLVLHKCDNLGCVNPDHLYLGTQSDNINQSSHRGRLYMGSRRVLTEQRDIDAMKRLYNNKVSPTDIIDAFGVSLSTFYRLIKQS